MAKPKKKHHNWCDFGEHYIHAGSYKRHVHPIPVCEAYPDGGLGGEGATACGKCYANIEAAQIAQGILLVE